MELSPVLNVLKCLFGNDKQPSGNTNVSSDVSTIFGFIKTNGSLTLITQTLLLIPIWLAANQTPLSDLVNSLSSCIPIS